MEPRRRRPLEGVVVSVPELVEGGETTATEAAGAKAEWRNTRPGASAASGREAPNKKSGEKNENCCWN